MGSTRAGAGSGGRVWIGTLAAAPRVARPTSDIGGVLTGAGAAAGVGCVVRIKGVTGADAGAFTGAGGDVTAASLFFPPFAFAAGGDAGAGTGSADFFPVPGPPPPRAFLPMDFIMRPHREYWQFAKRSRLRRVRGD